MHMARITYAALSEASKPEQQVLGMLVHGVSVDRTQNPGDCGIISVGDYPSIGNIVR